MADEELPKVKTKEINGVNLTNVEISKISMICDYLVLDRFNDISSFFVLRNVLTLYCPKKIQ